jgi:hypothetical protein
VFAGLVLVTVAQAAAVFDRPADVPSYPTEAEVAVPDQRRFLVVCQDPSGINRLMIGVENVVACPDGTVAMFVPQPRELRGVFPMLPTPSSAPS